MKTVRDVTYQLVREFGPLFRKITRSSCLFEQTCAELERKKHRWAPAQPTQPRAKYSIN
jgi:hypothetical protein